MNKLVAFLLLLVIVSCNTPHSPSSPEEQEVIDEGQFDSIIIYNDTKAPTKAIKALENRAYFLDSFPSKDSLIIFADIYIKERNAPTILLCHQAGYSRGEYKETAKTLNLYGYSVVALDQRSGNEVNGLVNLSHKNAIKDSLPTQYINARQDIEAAIDYIYTYTQKPILLLGSSYSASLSLLIGKNNPKVQAVAAFSPGEYFDSISIQDSLQGFDKPLFITSSKQEGPSITELIKNIEPHLNNQFIPSVNGFHGSKALWTDNKGNDLYWEAFSQFLRYEFPSKK
jgi:dienelactone hydrolase